MTAMIRKTLMKQVFKAMDVDTKQFKERSVLGTHILCEGQAHRS